MDFPLNLIRQVYHQIIEPWEQIELEIIKRVGRKRHVLSFLLSNSRNSTTSAPFDYFSFSPNLFFPFNQPWKTICKYSKQNTYCHRNSIGNDIFSFIPFLNLLFFHFLCFFDYRYLCSQIRKNLFYLPRFILWHVLGQKIYEFPSPVPFYIVLPELVSQNFLIS